MTGNHERLDIAVASQINAMRPYFRAPVLICAALFDLVVPTARSAFVRRPSRARLGVCLHVVSWEHDGIVCSAFVNLKVGLCQYSPV